MIYFSIAGKTWRCKSQVYRDKVVLLNVKYREDLEGMLEMLTKNGGVGERWK